MALPKGWVETTLGEVTIFNPKHDRDIDNDLEISFIPMPAVSDATGTIADHEARPIGEIRKAYTHFAEGDVIFAKITPCMENGKAAVAMNLKNGLAAGSSEFFVLRPDGAVNPTYLWRFLRQRSFRKRAERRMTGAVGQRRVPRPYLEDHAFPLPPYAEQKRIAAKLDALSARTARARTDLARTQKLAERYKQAVLDEAFERASKATQVSINDLSDKVFDGPFGSNLKSADYTEQGRRVVRLENLGRFQFIADKQTFISIDKFEALSRHMLHADDVIFSSFVGEEARVCMLPHDLDNAAINKADCFVIRIDRSKCLPKFLMYGLGSRTAFEEISALVHGATRPRINLKQLKAIRLPLPSLDEQREIVRRIETAFARVDAAVAEAEKALALTERLDEAILARAFRGDLVPQDPNDEPADKLLARIRAEREAKPKAARKKRTAAPGRKPRSSPAASIATAEVKEADPLSPVLQLLPAAGFTFEDILEISRLPFEKVRDAVMSRLRNPRSGLEQYYEESQRRMMFRKTV